MFYKIVKLRQLKVHQMLNLRSTLRHMSHLAAKFTGSSKVHVVDPLVDLRFIFEETNVLRRSLEERQLKIDVNEVKEKYSKWFMKYKAWTGAVESREVFPEHPEYLVQQGLMRIDKQREVVHLVGYPVLIQNSLKKDMVNIKCVLLYYNALHESRSQLLEMFCEATLVSPSCFIRAAILEGVNVPLEEYISFTDGSPSFPLTFIVGHSLPSLCSLFIRAQFSDKNNQWPITVHSAGMAYHKKRNTVDLAYSRQRLKHCVLSMAQNNQQMDEFIIDATSKIGAILDEGLLLDVEARVVKGKELKNFESQAIVFEDKGLELARVIGIIFHSLVLHIDLLLFLLFFQISRIGTYIPWRLNTTFESGSFVNMTYVETDIDRILARLVDGLVDGRDMPKSLRDIVKQS
uniref:Uncharacterized protein n=1 Tax=Heterorhabditis bacteriophora TaxID=37862 RepID=A0A1I7WQB8_HETBA